MTTIESSITGVAVFPNRARVTRSGTVSLSPGRHQVEFTELPLSLLPDSIRVAGRGTAAASLIGVETRRTFFAETPTATIRELEVHIEALADEDKMLADQAAVTEMLSAFARKLADQSAEQLALAIALGRADTNRGRELAAFAQQQFDEALTSARDVAQKRRDLARRTAKLKQELEAKGTARTRERFTAAVEVDVAREGDLTLELTYMVGDAGWEALYDLRADLTVGDKPRLIIDYLGQVHQSTGEDWMEVELVLSTARPALAGVRPELKPWYISPLSPPTAVIAKYAKPMQLGTLEAAVPQPAAMTYERATMGEVEEVMEEAMAIPSAQAESHGASVTFKVPGTASVPGDGTPHKVNITALEFKPRIDYVTVPKLSEFAYRRSKVNNQSDFLLLPGNASLFVNGDYVGALGMRLTAPGEEFELTLGVEDRIYVKRQLKAREVDKKLIGDRRRVRIGYEIELRNLMGREVELEVLDQIPVAVHEQIKVRFEAAEPKPADQSELNELKWQCRLEPSAERNVRFDFSVEYPTAMTVQGLPLS